MNGRQQLNMHRSRWKRREWDENDSTLLHDEMRVLFGEHKYLQEYMSMGVFKDLLNGQGKRTTGVAVDDDGFAQNFPCLHALMCGLVDDDGSPRQTATLTIVCEDGQVKVGINERNHHLSLWTSSASLGGAFASIEGALTERPVAWRKVTWKGKGGRP